MNDVVLDIWNKLPVDTKDLLEVRNHCFDYPSNATFIKGVFHSTVWEGVQIRFMSFGVGISTSLDDDEDPDRAIVTFFQVRPFHWAFSMSLGVERGTFSDSLPCCEHAVKLVHALAKGESAQMHLVDPDGAPVMVHVNPLVVN